MTMTRMSVWIVRRMIWIKTMMDEVEEEGDYCNTGDVNEEE